MCDEPKIDNSTQEPMNCTNHTAYGKDFQRVLMIIALFKEVLNSCICVPAS